MVLAIVPGNLEVAQVPQMITLSFNGAVNVDNIPIYQELFAEGKTELFIWCHLVADFRTEALHLRVEFRTTTPPTY